MPTTQDQDREPIFQRRDLLLLGSVGLSLGGMGLMIRDIVRQKILLGKEQEAYVKKVVAAKETADTLSGTMRDMVSHVIATNGPPDPSALSELLTLRERLNEQIDTLTAENSRPKL